MLSQRVCRVLPFLLLSPALAAAEKPGALADRLARQMAVNEQRYGIAAQAVHVTRNGRELFVRVAGQADLETGRRATRDDVFPAYSLSKLFASTLVMQLVEQDAIELDRPAGTYVPGLPPRWREVTVRQLLSHTSGLPEYFSDAQMTGTAQANASFPATLSAVFAALADTPFVFASGTETRYTQTNFLVLTALLETHYGKPYADIATERIIGRLRLRHTCLGRDGLPGKGVVTGYLGKNGQLQREPDIAWPKYALGHAALYTSVGDLATFLRAVTDGDLVAGKTLQQLWQPQTLPGGQRGWFAAGWEIGESGEYRQVGHDGGARVRVRILFRDTLDGDVYTVIYLTNGSRRNVWSRTLVDSIVAGIAPQRFRSEALAEQLTAFALRNPGDEAIQQFADTLAADGALRDLPLERVVNNTGYAIRSNLGTAVSIPVFTLNTRLFPASVNAWDSLAEAHEADGASDRAKAARAKKASVGAASR
ncbi:MAG TPA: serine hydrolase domain-containing protein [Tahibacter sp.]|uniref:serine hydrolase domain-containing protein n=1 Tax=Tahibacter sp. TaxID=2056211 RepID=UPI002BE345CF|nr:serine hydrolase domain-containing protein [Tahibacter sp.]HSX60384.1 serine hydrolase domain-containing protein [Tahibacter sp.]